MSNETKFTKGDWVLAEGKTYCAVKQKETGVIIADMRTVNSIYNTHNANLIKTAPKLYVEIESEIEFLTKIMTDNFTVNCYQSFEIGGRIDLLKKLLSEARGE